MILNAVKKGVSEERLARALNVDIANIRLKRNLLVGICPEVADLLRDRHVPLHAFAELRKLKPVRQIAVAQGMVTMNRYTISYVKSMVAATPQEQLVDGKKPLVRKGISKEQLELMQRESENVTREFRLIEKDYGADNFDLSLAIAYVNQLLDNAAVIRHLAQHHSDILSAFQQLADWQKAA